MDSVSCQTARLGYTALWEKPDMVIRVLKCKIQRQTDLKQINGFKVFLKKYM